MRGNTSGLFAILLIAGCYAHDEGDTGKSANRLDLAKDFLRKHQLEAAEMECNRALAFFHGNDEAYVVGGRRAPVQLARASDPQRRLEVEGCPTGADAEATRKDLDASLAKADHDFAEAIRLSPDYGEAWSNRGVVHNLQEDFAGAATMLTHALENPMRLDSPGLTRAHL